MKNARTFKHVFARLRETTRPALDERIWTDICQAMDASRCIPRAVGHPTIWRMMMKSKVIQGATAAAIVFFTWAGLYHFFGAAHGNGLVLADVIEKMEPVSTVKHREAWTVTVVGEDKPFMNLDVYKYAATDRGVVIHLHYPDDSPMKQIYFLSKQKNGTILFPQSKKYVQVPLGEQFLRRLTQLTPKGVVTWIQEGDYKQLARRKIEGVTAVGFEVKNPPSLNDLMEIQKSLFPIKDSLVRLWVDVETSLPVAVEMELMTGSGLFTGWRELKIETYAYDLEWNAEIDPKIFQLDIPADYTPLIPFGRETGVESIKKLLGIGSKNKE
ncbi:MAG: hypothetical protein JW810_03925 [Sedimentisphaerales bacterium]|nr:hypothetical protein [Sedimentisphaerales bacterium]